MNIDRDDSDAPVPGKRRRGRQTTRWCKIRQGKCGVEGGGRIGQEKPEEFRRPPMMEKPEKETRR